MKVKVDVLEVHDLTREAVRRLDAAPSNMKRILDGAAAKERASHTYQNRTGDLERGTQAGPIEGTGDAYFVQLMADTEYASYVNARGYMRIDEFAREAEREIETDLLFDAGILSEYP